MINIDSAMIPNGIQPEQLLKDFLQLKKGGGHAAKGGISFSAVLGGASDPFCGNRGSRGIREMSSTREPARGHALMARIKKYLQAQSGNLDKVTADARALNAFGRVLLSAGFDETAVMDMIAQVKESGGKNGIKLSDLFAQLSGLDEEMSAKDNDLAAISALPFLESILLVLGLASEKIDAVLSGATVEGEGIRLSRLVSGLRGIDAGVPPGKSPEGPGSHFIREINDHIKHHINQMMRQLGIGSFSEQEEGLTINKLIMQLEALMARNADKETSPGLQTAETNRFLSSLKVHDGIAANVFLTEKLNRQVTMSRLKVGNKRAVTPDAAAKAGLEIGIEKGVAPYQAGVNEPGTVNTRILQNAVGAEFLLNDKPPGGGKPFSGDTGFGAGNSRRNPMENGVFFHPEELNGPGASTHLTAASGKTSAGKSLPAYVLNQVGRQIFRSVQQNQTEIHLQLKPPHLGRLRLSLETVNDGLRVSIMTEHQSTREMLRVHSGELRTALMEQGVRLEKIDVQVAFNFEQSMADSNKNLKKFHKRRDRGFELESDVRKAREPIPLNRLEAVWRADGKLHTIA